MIFYYFFLNELLLKRLKTYLFQLNPKIVRIKQEGEDMERILRERINKMEGQRLDHEEEIGRLKAANVADKLNAEEQVSSMKHRLKSEEVRI